MSRKAARKPAKSKVRVASPAEAWDSIEDLKAMLGTAMDALNTLQRQVDRAAGAELRQAHQQCSGAFCALTRAQRILDDADNYQNLSTGGTAC